MSGKSQQIEMTNIQTLHPTDQPGNIVLVDKAPQVTILALCTQNGVKHVVQKSNVKTNAEIAFSNQVTNSPSSFFQYPLSCILGIANPSEIDEKKVSRISLTVTRAAERKNILEEIENYVTSLTISPSLRNDILIVVDETLSNAIYSAPIASQQGKTILESREKSEIDCEKKPMIFAGHDGERIIVGCRDSYGSLNIDNLLRRIKSCYDTNVSDMINFGEGGAGIGTFLVFDSCSSMYLGVDADRATIICCSFPYKMTAAQRSDLPKNLHIIER